MGRHLAVWGLAAVVVIAESHAAFAGGRGGLLCGLFPWLCGGGGHPGPAPAPLLAAGIPAFTALGGGVLVSRFFRKRKTQD